MIRYDHRANAVVRVSWLLALDHSEHCGLARSGAMLEALPSHCARRHFAVALSADERLVRFDFTACQ